MTRMFLSPIVALTIFFSVTAAMGLDNFESPDQPSEPVTESENAKAAKQRFDEGTASYEAGEYSRAANAFREANQMNPNWRLYFNIGQCEALAKRHGLALQAFEAYLSTGGDDIPLTRQAEVRTEIKRLREMTGALEITAPDGARIIVDGVERGVSPLAGHIPVAAGVTHLVEIEKMDGAPLNSQKVIVVGGKTVRLDFREEKKNTELSAPPEPETNGIAPPGPNQKPVVASSVRKNKSALYQFAITSLFASGAVLIASGVTGLAARNKYDRLDERCPEKTCTSESDEALMEEIDTLTLATDILLTTGGVLAITGIILLAADRGRAVDNSSVVSFRPFPGGVQLEGKF